MYKLLIVDDEANIRTGIAENCDWAHFQVSEIETAINGLDAWEKIQAAPPDFLITDIKMPVMDGLALTEKVSLAYPDILCAVLSGYDEFDFVRDAMRFHVQNYLLKPCSIEAIHELMAELISKKAVEQAKKEYLNKIETEYLQLKQHFTEQALKDFITNAYTCEEELKLHSDCCNLIGAQLRLLLVHIEKSSVGSALYSLQQTCRSILERETPVYVCTPCNDCLLILIPYYSFQTLLPLLHEIKESFYKYFSSHITITVGEQTCLQLLKASYKNLLICSGSRFYATEEDIITTFDIPDAHFTMSSSTFNIDLFCLAVQRGNLEEIRSMLCHLYHTLTDLKYDIHQIRAYLIHIYVALIQLEDASLISDHLIGITKITSLSSLGEIIDLIHHTAESIISAMQFKIQKRQNELIQKTTAYVEHYLSDERLTLGFIAHDLLYVNADYLGKLFSAEYGEKFSSYVTKKRIELAKDLLLDARHIPINEIANQVGFGYNSQYFSKVFKKSTGYTPTEYRINFSNYN